MHSEVGLEGSEAMWSTAVQTTEDSSCPGVADCNHAEFEGWYFYDFEFKSENHTLSKGFQNLVWQQTKYF